MVENNKFKDHLLSFDLIFNSKSHNNTKYGLKLNFKYREMLKK